VHFLFVPSTGKNIGLKTKIDILLIATAAAAAATTTTVITIVTMTVIITISKRLKCNMDT